ncbi:MAG: PASTA domain-containing protein [Vicinamibacterales bacterium]
MPLARGLWSAGRVLALLAALGVTFAGSAVLGLRLALRSREVPVPDLIGLSVDTATERLAADGLALRLDASRREHPGVQPDRIAQQDPAPGVSTRRPRAVRVWLKAPARATLVPDLTGGTDRTARIRAGQAGVQLDPPVVVPDERPAGTVIAQAPAAGTPGESVRLVVSGGPGAWPVLVPDVTGVDVTAAAGRFTAAGLRVVLTPRRRPAGTAAGLVAAQHPLPGSPAGGTDTITLEVYR